MKKLGFDLDGVLYPWQELAYEYLRLHNKTNLSYVDFWRLGNIEATYSRTFLDNLLSLPFLYSQAIPNKRMMQVLYTLEKRFDICYVTARRDESVGLVTREYLRRYRFPNYTDVYFTQDKTKTVRFLELDYYVEDQIKYAVPISKVCTVFLKSATYNSDLEDSNITRIYDIAELLTLI